MIFKQAINMDLLFQYYKIPMDMLFQYIILPAIITIFLIYLIVAHYNKKDKMVIAARGGMRELYSKLIDAVLKMPGGMIILETATSLTLSYFNQANKLCHIKVRVTGGYTYVEFSILYKYRFVTISKEEYYEVLTGNDVLWEIAVRIPESDLSYESDFHC